MKTYADEPSQVIQLQPVNEQMEEQKINPIQPPEINENTKITLDMPISEVKEILRKHHGFDKLSFGKTTTGTLQDLINKKTDVTNKRQWWYTLEAYTLFKKELEYIQKNNLMNKNDVANLIYLVDQAILKYNQ